MFTFLLVLHAIIAAALVGVILMQRSEGGGLGMGGSPSGLMSARGAADFLTRATTILAVLFVAMCVFLAVLAATRNGPAALDNSLVRIPVTAPAGQAPIPAPLPTTDPLSGGNSAAAVSPSQSPTTGNAQRSAPATPRVDRTPERATPADPVARTAQPKAPGGNGTGETRLPGVVSAPSIPAGNSQSGNATGPNN